MIVLPAMPPEQRASWLGVLDLHDKRPTGRTLIGRGRHPNGATVQPSAAHACTSLGCTACQWGS
jgi:hypothetical protein